MSQQNRQLEKYSRGTVRQEDLLLLDSISAQDTQLHAQLDSVVYENQQLEKMLATRRLIVLEYKRDNKDTGIQLDRVRRDIETQASRITKLHEEMSKEMMALKHATSKKGRQIREVFGDKLMAEIGKFEETHAIKEIFKNEDQMQQSVAREQMAKRSLEKERSQEETKRSVARLREERKQMDATLMALTKKFVQLK